MDVSIGGVPAMDQPSLVSTAVDAFGGPSWTLLATIREREYRLHSIQHEG